MLEGSIIAIGNHRTIRMIRETIDSVQGNARACVFLEPLFSIPHTMFTGYMTLYMLELGVTTTQVGLITSMGLVIHIFFALISTYITDKLGRRYTTLIFDITGWFIPQLIWAVALDIRFFIVAAIFSASFRVVANSWRCLMLEDSKPESMVHVFNVLQAAGILGGFFAPIGALLINRMTLVPAMRVMLVFSMISMMLMFIIRHFGVTETAVGRQKMEEMKGVKIRDVFKSYIPTLKRIFRERLLMIVLLLHALNFIQLTIRTTFLAILVTESMRFPAEAMAVFHIITAVVMLLTLLLLAPMLSHVTRRWPISLGVGFHIAAIVVLLLSPPSQNYFLLVLGAIFIALGTSIATPRIEALLANTIVNEERSVANAVMAVIVLVLTVPFGYIGGVLAGIDARLPFFLTLGILLLSLLLIRIATALELKAKAA